MKTLNEELRRWGKSAGWGYDPGWLHSYIVKQEALYSTDINKYEHIWTHTYICVNIYIYTVYMHTIYTQI
jgi:hypothetical protein